MLFIEIRLTLTVSMLGILIADATWPCLVHIDWTPFILDFVAILILCMFLHMLRWKCWSYLCHICHNRQRLRSMSSKHKRPLRIVRIIWASLVVWSVAYALASALLGCRTPWWPGLIVPMWSLISYTVSICSTSCSSSEEPESSNENALESGSASSKRSSLYSESSNGNSSSDEES